MLCHPATPGTAPRKSEGAGRAHSCRSSAHRPAGPSRRLSLFSPGTRRLRALHVLVFRGAAWRRREHAALSVTAPAAGFGGLGAAAGREAFVPQQKQAPEWQPRQAGIKEPSRWMLATCPHRQLPLLPKDHASRCGSAPAPTAGVRTAHQGAQVASTLLGTENLPVSASCLL